MSEELSFDQEMLNEFFKKAEEKEDIFPSTLIKNLKTEIDNKTLNFESIINLVDKEIEEENA